MAAQQREAKLIVRLLGTDLDGTKHVPFALAAIEGVGINLGYAISRALGIDPTLRLGQLSEQQLSQIEDAIRNPLKYGIPVWMLNRRSDPVTGKNLHLIGPDLRLAVREDIEREKRIRSWRGVRHALGLKVRGQRTRTTGRKGGPVGVARKAK
ncbi:MAG: 30S ribosomal protein S13 [Thaumarchaeota archaeon]|nr:30S ribosomal protein S13 [Candidatus Calditenuaceae archaeon]MCX8202979.1 30S ribosomal protein S13 [Nitrososphaeria archaeon]MDW8042772.1 30S ribosomal protein S13 [Nitrososphaerota archaeon]